MPQIKTKRKDILRRAEILKMLSDSPKWLQCYIALLWAFGKRTHEVLKVKKEDVWVDKGYLYVRFYVGKKRKHKGEPYLKRITEAHPAVPYIIDYAKEVEEGSLFTMSRQLVHYYLKKVNSEVYAHLFRHSLATEMSEKSFTVQQLMAWFDWDDPEQAMAYVQRGPGLTKELSERTW
jgi:integrase